MLWGTSWDRCLRTVLWEGARRDSRCMSCRICDLEEPRGATRGQSGARSASVAFAKRRAQGPGSRRFGKSSPKKRVSHGPWGQGGSPGARRPRSFPCANRPSGVRRGAPRGAPRSALPSPCSSGRVGGRRQGCAGGARRRSVWQGLGSQFARVFHECYLGMGMETAPPSRGDIA